MRRVLFWLVGALAALVAIIVVAYFGYNLYVERIVSANPSTQEVVRTGDAEFQLGAYSGGDQVATGATAPAAVPVAGAPSGDQTPSGTPPVGTPSASQPTPDATQEAASTRPILPPTKLTIPKIGVDASVVLADAGNLPEFKAAGWFLGTGYPGFRGNVVIFGHLNGDYETFGRLHELVPSDEVVVQTEAGEYHYVVTESKVVPAADLSVLAPTGDYRLTLITCTGTFIPKTRDYTDRLIVTASLIPQTPGS